MNYVDIPHIDYCDIEIHNASKSVSYFDDYITDKYNDYYCLTEEDFNTNYDNRCITSGIENIYENEFNDYLKDYFSYVEYNEVYDY